MIDLKRDVLEELLREKRFIEIENSRLAQNPIVSYKEMVETITKNLLRLAVINGTFGLLDVYFPEPKPVQAPVQTPFVEKLDVAPQQEGSPFPKIN